MEMSKEAQALYEQYSQKANPHGLSMRTINSLKRAKLWDVETDSPNKEAIRAEIEAESLRNRCVNPGDVVDRRRPLHISSTADCDLHPSLRHRSRQKASQHHEGNAPRGSDVETELASKKGARVKLDLLGSEAQPLDSGVGQSGDCLNARDMLP